MVCPSKINVPDCDKILGEAAARIKAPSLLMIGIVPGRPLEEGENHCNVLAS